MMYMTEINNNRRATVEVSPAGQSYRSIAAARRKKRNRILLQRCALVAFVITLVVLGICLFAPSVKANAESDVSYEKRIVSVRVTENDSLWKIAERFYCSEKESIRDFIEDIKKINHLENDTIYPDTYLVIQYYAKKLP